MELIILSCERFWKKCYISVINLPVFQICSSGGVVSLQIANVSEISLEYNSAVVLRAVILCGFFCVVFFFF